MVVWLTTQVISFLQTAMKPPFTGMPFCITPAYFTNKNHTELSYHDLKLH